MSENIVRTRIAPSPTGQLHIGTLATALRNMAFAKQKSGQFIIRIEDTDRERLVPGALENALKVLKLYGLSWDEGPDIGGPYSPYVQSERLSLYKQYAEELVNKKLAYRCFCTKERLEEMRKQQQANKQLPKYDRTCLKLMPFEIQDKLDQNISHVIRLKVPDNEIVEFTDQIRGNISFPTVAVDDQVLLKSDGYPTYHLGVVVDDHLMQITHIIRGEEWISSTPKHILLYKAFGWELPIYAHTPVFLSPTGKGKMSKRQGDVSAQHFLEIGYLPEAILNFLMIMGWAPNNGKEILTLDEFIKQFNLEAISKKSVAFDVDKLNWLNGIYIRNLPDEVLSQKLLAFLPVEFPKEKMPQILPLIKDRLVILADVVDLTSFFYQSIQPDLSLLLKKSTDTEVIDQLSQTISALESISAWNTEAIETAIRDIETKNQWKRNQYFMMLRLAVTGKTATPPLFETIEVLGKDTTINRLVAAKKLLEN
jgi:glutamyl-tRNA synthetase